MKKTNGSEESRPGTGRPEKDARKLSVHGVLLVTRIVHGDFGGAGEDVRIKDFVDFEKLDKPAPANGSEKAEQE